MKKILSFLLTIVFMQAQVFALSGGPTYAGAQPLEGNYAGVMIPQFKNKLFENPTVVPTTLESDANSLGIFVLTIPSAGASTGNFLYFDEGEVYFGTIQAVANPNTASVIGLLAAVTTTNDNGDVGFQAFSPFNAVGKFDTKVIGGSGFQVSRIVGEAFVQNQAFLPNKSQSGFGLGVVREITFLIDGVQQAGASSSATLSKPQTVPSGGQ